MFLINDDMSIYVTRGDIAFITVSATYDNDTAYKFQPGDILRMRVFEKKACENVVMVKNYEVTEEAEEVTLFLKGSDTKIGGVISKPIDYWYEIELNPDTNPQTIVGYDEENGAARFRLFPEGKDITEGELDEYVKSDVQKIIEDTAKDYFANTPLSGSIEDEVNKYMKNNPVSNGLTPYIGEDGNWWIGIVNTGVSAAGNDGEDGEDGADGITPLIRINKTTSEMEVSYDNGATYENTGVLARGADGKDGEDGQAGVTFTPKVDSEGNLSWENDGGLENPAVVNIKGRDGVIGKDGKDGYTPVKGTDYFTDEDKAGFVQEIKDTVPMVLYEAQEQKAQARENIGATGEELAEDVFATCPTPTNIQVLKAGTVIQINIDQDNGETEAVQISLDAYDHPMIIQKDGKSIYMTWEGFV